MLKAQSDGVTAVNLLPVLEPALKTEMFLNKALGCHQCKVVFFSYTAPESLYDLEQFPHFFFLSAK